MREKTKDENKQITIKEKVITLVIGATAIILVLGSYSVIKFYVSKPTQPKVDPVVIREEIEEEKKDFLSTIEAEVDELQKNLDKDERLTWDEERIYEIVLSDIKNILTKLKENK